MSAPLPGDVLALLRAHGPLTRADVMERTGLARATANQRLDVLVAAGLAVPTEGESTARGRPPGRFRFHHDRGVMLIADVGATSFRAALTDLLGEIRLVRSTAIDVGDGPGAVLGAVSAFFDELLAEAGYTPADVLGIGLDVPGPVDFASGRVVNPPIMSGWDGYDIPGWFRPTYDCPVVVENDVNAVALGEQRTAHPDVPSLLMIKVGTGVGAGLIWRGEIYRGADGAAGDIGHIQVSVPGEEAPPLCRCGNHGCVEARAGGWALVRDLRATGHDVSTVDDAADLVRQGDADAVGHVRRAGRLLGSAVADAVSLLNPRAVVLTGQLAFAEQLMAGVREMVYSRSLPLATARIDITRSALGTQGGLVGTALLVADHVFAPERIEHLLRRG